MSPSDRADSWNQAQPIGAENKDEDGRKEPKCAFDQMRANDTFQKTVETSTNHSRKFCAPPGTRFMFRVATLAKMIKPMATTQLTTIELVMKLPQRSILTADCDRPCSASAANTVRATPSPSTTIVGARFS